jgi:hypothetical protein
MAQGGGGALSACVMGVSLSAVTSLWRARCYQVGIIGAG